MNTTSSIRLPSALSGRPALFESATLLNVNRVTSCPLGTRTVPSYVSHWSSWPVPVDVIVVDSSPALSPALAMVRRIVTGFSRPGAPTSTCMLSLASLLRLACFRRTVYMASDVFAVSMSW